jgi:RND family efflux transporter MFP subunit
MIAQVGEEDLSRVRPGMPARVTVQAYPNRFFPGKVARLGEQLDPATRTLQVRVDLPNAAGLLKPEMYASAELAAGGGAPGLFVPETALQDVSGRQMIFVRRSATVYAPRVVRTGRRANGQVEILDGLAEGEQVAVAGAFVLKSQLLKATLSEE